MTMTGLVPAAVHGFCDYRFRAVKDAFRTNFDLGLEVGASVAVELEGRRVVDLWAGHVDAEQTRVWQPDTLVNVYSSTKGIVAVCANRLVDQGRLDLDVPVARYWPEFAQARKGSIPVRYLLDHRAGLPAIRQPLPSGSQFDWNLMTETLARTETWWEPGTKHGYHAITFGWLVGEVIRRIAQQSVGAYLRTEVAGPFGIDFHIGLSMPEERRVAHIIPRAAHFGEDPSPLDERLRDHDSVSYHALANPRDMMAASVVNSREWRAAEIPAANGQSNARALARLYGILATGGGRDTMRLLSDGAIHTAARTQVNGPDEVLGIHTRFGLGFALAGESCYYGPNPNTLGHPGAGGSTGFADLDAKLGFGYAMNQLMGKIGQEDPRRRRLIDAVYDGLER